MAAQSSGSLRPSDVEVHTYLCLRLCFSSMTLVWCVVCGGTFVICICGVKGLGFRV
jgi:hypothetical protein